MFPLKWAESEPKVALQSPDSARYKIWRNNWKQSKKGIQ